MPYFIASMHPLPVWLGNIVEAVLLAPNCNPPCSYLLCFRAGLCRLPDMSGQSLRTLPQLPCHATSHLAVLMPLQTGTQLGMPAHAHTTSPGPAALPACPGSTSDVARVGEHCQLPPLLM